MSSRRDALAALGLDVAYERGEGSRLWYGPDDTPVWDMLGGYGATFAGHNHPTLVRVMTDFLARGGVMHAQVSRRSASDRLRAALDERLLSALGRRHEFVFASTGVEAVEIAAKHSEQVWFARRDALAERCAPAARTRDALGTPFSDVARARLSQHGLWKGERTLRAILEHNRRTLQRPPVFVALRGAFHGMTQRGLQLTDDQRGAAHFGAHLGTRRVRRIDRDMPGQLERVFEKLTLSVWRIVLRDGFLDVESEQWLRVAGLIFEPIQGEGGIHPLDREMVREWQAACNARRVPLIADEIQSGMGRSGSFLYCEQLGVTPDVTLLGKSLGGGLVKVSAVAIAKEEFRESFSMQHSSTFAEDDLSALVATRTLGLLEEEDAMGRAARAGARILDGLRSIARRYPDLIADVRGQGLMIGIEWRRQCFDRSHLLRFLDRRGWMGYARAAYLLRAHGVRVAPPLAQSAIIRIEPAYAVPDEAIDALLSGLDALCAVLARQDVAALLGPSFDVPVPAPAPAAAPRRERGVVTRYRPRRVVGNHVAFIGHFIDEDGVSRWDPGLGRLGLDTCRRFLDRVQPLAEPMVCLRAPLTSATGATTTLSFIGLPVSSAQCHAALRDRSRRDELRALIQRAVDLAQAKGCRVVGLGGYTSILTRNGKSLDARGMALTTGNGFAVGAGLVALRAVAREEGHQIAESQAAVVGASGNIGSVLAALLSREVRSLVLVGRPEHRGALEFAAARLLTSVVREAPHSPIAQVVANLVGATELAAEEPGLLLDRLRRALGGRSPIDVAITLQACREASLIASASNAPGPLLFPEHLGEGRNVLLDLAVPGDADDSLAHERPGTRLVRGGVVSVPSDPSWSVPGIPLEHGTMFACMAETVLMGFADAQRDGSIGALTTDRVFTTLEMARIHGFDAITSTSGSNHAVGRRSIAYSR